MMIIVTRTTTAIIMIKNKGAREEKEKERLRQRAIIYNTVTSKISNVIFTNHIFSAYILH